MLDTTHTKITRLLQAWKHHGFGFATFSTLLQACNNLHNNLKIIKAINRLYGFYI